MVLSRNVLILSICLVSLLGLLQAGEQTTDATSDFAFLQPWFDLRRDEREKLVQRRVVVRGLPGHGKQRDRDYSGRVYQSSPCGRRAEESGRVRRAVRRSSGPRESCATFTG